MASQSATWRQALKAVAWSFLGIRKRADHAQDVAQLRPVHVVLVGITLGLLFVLLLVWVVGWVVSSGVAH